MEKYVKKSFTPESVEEEIKKVDRDRRDKRIDPEICRLKIANLKAIKLCMTKAYISGNNITKKQ